MSGLRGALWAGVPVNVPDLVTVCVTAAATTVSGPECGSAVPGGRGLVLWHLWPRAHDGSVCGAKSVMMVCVWDCEDMQVHPCACL